MTVLVTGASGFIGSYVVMELLERGFSVRAMVRDIKLKSIFRDSDKLEVVVGDLFDVDSLKQAVGGCEDVVHCAAALYVNAKDLKKEVVDPSIVGVRNLCSVMDDVKRVIHTSSVAAIRPTKYENGMVFDSKSWCDDASEEVNPYGFAKSEAEKIMRKWAEKRDVRLVTIHPSVVFGPILHKRHAEGSMSYLKHFKGKFPFLLNIHVNFVDVRDVAKAHVNALDLGENGSRIIIHKEGLWLKEIGRVIGKKWYVMPRLFAYFISIFHPKLSWRMINSSLNRFVDYDVEDAFQILNIEGYDSNTTLNDAFNSL